MNNKLFASIIIGSFLGIVGVGILLYISRFREEEVAPPVRDEEQFQEEPESAKLPEGSESALLPAPLPPRESLAAAQTIPVSEELPARPGSCIHVVRTGETFSSVVNLYKVDPSELRKANAQSLKEHFSKVCSGLPEEFLTRPLEKGYYCNSNSPDPETDTIAVGLVLEIPPGKKG